jgi:hypothetical protein
LWSARWIVSDWDARSIGPCSCPGSRTRPWASGAETELVMVVLNSVLCSLDSMSASISGSKREGSLLTIEIDDERDVDEDAVDPSTEVREGSMIFGTTMVD